MKDVTGNMLQVTGTDTLLLATCHACLFNCDYWQVFTSNPLHTFNKVHCKFMPCFLILFYTASVERQGSCPLNDIAHVCQHRWCFHVGVTVILQERKELS